MWSPNELLKTEKQRDILSYITLQFFPFKKVPLEHYPKGAGQTYVIYFLEFSTAPTMISTHWSMPRMPEFRQIW